MIVENLTIEAGKKKIVENFSFKLDKGIEVIYGECDTGKTTLMVSIAGLEDFFELKVHGKVSADCSILFEETDNQIIGYRVKDEIKIAKIKQDYLKILGLDGYEDREIHTLSGGELKKLCIAEALSKNKKEIILDDPESHLDPQALEDLWNILIKLSNDRAILILTRRPDLYDVPEVHTMDCKRIQNEFQIRPISKKRIGQNDAVIGRGITFPYGDRTIFNNVDFRIKGGISVITGRNGSGKTTLLKIISGLLVADGELMLKSNSVSYVHQFPYKAFFYDFVWEEANAALGENYNEILDLFGINPEKKISELNRSEKTLLAIACALKADIVCLDEPTSSLDLKGIEILMDVLESVSKDFIIASNDRTFIKALRGSCTFYKIEGGRIHEEQD